MHDERKNIKPSRAMVVDFISLKNYSCKYQK
jgi:hypothetical protein